MKEKKKEDIIIDITYIQLWIEEEEKRKGKLNDFCDHIKNEQID